jgi:hypothetical protein
MKNQINRTIKVTIKKAFNLLGLNVVQGKPTNLSRETEFPIDFQKEHEDIILDIKPYTQTSYERIFALIESVKYVTQHRIPGDIVECGVWKGGSMMAVAKTLKKLNSEHRHLYLFDTFEGMSNPTEKDVIYYGRDAKEILQESNKESQESLWCYASLDEVKKNLASCCYDIDKIHFIKGKVVEETIPDKAPKSIAILRLDTDWYESTKHELFHLFPLLSAGGVLIIDDYGWWKGAKEATDEYIKDNNIKILLNRIDCTGRIAVKN